MRSSLVIVFALQGCIMGGPLLPRPTSVSAASIPDEAADPAAAANYVGSFRLRGAQPLKVDDEQLELRLGYTGDGKKSDDPLVLELCPSGGTGAACTRQDVSTARTTGRSVAFDKWLVTATREGRGAAMQIQIYRLDKAVDDSQLALAASRYAADGACKHARRMISGIRDDAKRAAQTQDLPASCAAKLDK